MNNKQLIAFRDPCGIRPLSIGTLEGGYVVASETCAFDTIGATFLRDVEPGEMVVIDEHGLTSHQVVKGEQKLDIFELVYFARPDSLLLGKRVDMVRQEFGRVMAKEFPIEADVIIPVPESGIPAALGYSQASGHSVRNGPYQEPLHPPHLHSPHRPAPRARPQDETQPGYRTHRRSPGYFGRRLDLCAAPPCSSWCRWSLRPAPKKFIC
jgi:hypothetical protein